MGRVWGVVWVNMNEYQGSLQECGGLWGSAGECCEVRGSVEECGGVWGLRG